MNINSSDTYAQNAKSLMIMAQVVSYVCLFSVAFFDIYLYMNSEKEQIKALYNQLGKSYKSYKSPSDNYTILRIITFSTLMFVSIVVAALCFAASKEIETSQDSSMYGNQYTLCKDLGRLFFLHFMLFTIIQGFSYIYQIFYENGNIKTDPTKIVTGKDPKLEPPPKPAVKENNNTTKKTTKSNSNPGVSITGDIISSLFF